MDNIFNFVKTNIYDKFSFRITNLLIESESREYFASQFELNGKKVLCRNSKITPKKKGQFVTFWKRNSKGVIEPFHEKDLIDFFVINVKSGNNLGQFVFPKSELINRGILTSDKKDGKRGFRVYPNWDKVESKQAITTQKWQLKFFYTIDEFIDGERVSKLYSFK